MQCGLCVCVAKAATASAIAVTASTSSARAKMVLCYFYWMHLARSVEWCGGKGGGNSFESRILRIFTWRGSVQWSAASNLCTNNRTLTGSMVLGAQRTLTNWLARSLPRSLHLSISHSFIYYITQYATHLLWCLMKSSSSSSSSYSGFHYMDTRRSAAFAMK